MNDPIQNEAETQELKRAIAFRCAPADETDEGNKYAYQRSR